ncbi:DUF2752 domain-containing protein [Mycobacterium sp. OTB74]|uniref:DUF2752 domain-containing protein n=1 Tax=Mycobacterium sp. OTB74 TaxID=1853452 RepID=UPI00247657A5|nr:DUF2752 domain-containing protein [Mycobacterium sp. OTB74]MDH6247823.1 hypothetical protein [Mycobacterium sp. OTB74]
MTSSGRIAVVAGVSAATATVAGALAYVGLADPHRPGFLYPPCPFRMLTGWYCPLCGGLRMTHDVLHGDLAAAVHDNAFALVGLPVLVLWLALSWRRGRPAITAVGAVAVVVVLALWTVIRNVPGFPWEPTFLAG